MAWLSLIIALLKAVSALSEYAKQKQLIDAATADLLTKQMEAAGELVQKARDARRAAADKFDAAGGVPDPKDPNLRD